jgi:hypothetical protein
MIFKDLTQNIYDWFDSNIAVKEVTFGDTSEVDITSETDFPLVHIVPTGISSTLESFTEFGYTIYILTNKDELEDSIDSLDITSNILIEFNNAVRYGKLFGEQIRVKNDGDGTVVYDKFGNRLYGYQVSYNLLVPNYKC